MERQRNWALGLAAIAAAILLLGWLAHEVPFRTAGNPSSEDAVVGDTASADRPDDPDPGATP